MPKFNDNTLMPWGVHEGVEMANVPDQYLMWLWGENKEEYRAGSLHGTKLSIMEYIEDSFEGLP